MSSFAGLSVIYVSEDGETFSCDTSAVDAGADSGYHLLMVKGYSRTKELICTGESIKSGTFMVGGRRWYIEYYPNGKTPDCAGFISLYASLHYDDDDTEQAMEAKCSFSLIDQVDKQKQMYIRGCKTCSFSSSHPSWGRPRFVRRVALERSADLNDDCFTIRCDIKDCSDPKTEGAGGTPSDLHQHFSYLLQTKVGTDVTFDVKGQTFAAHRCVLAARSEVFMAELFGSMKEGSATSDVIPIKGMEAKVFEALLSFIYTDSFPVSMEEDEMSKAMEGGQDEEAEGEAVVCNTLEIVEPTPSEAVMDGLRLQWLQHLFVAADRYGLEGLKFICEKQLSEHVGVYSVASVLALAEELQCCGLKEACFKFIQAQPIFHLQEVMSTNDWKHMKTAHPPVVDELILKLASSQRK